MTRKAREAKEPFSARFSRSTLLRLRRRAEQRGVAQTALAERYIDEGLRMDEHPLIHFRDGAGGRRPALLGSRLDVAQVIETIKQNESSVAAAADYLSLPPAQVAACVAYYVAYGDEIDAWTARERDAAEQAEVSWRRGREPSERLVAPTSDGDRAPRKIAL